MTRTREENAADAAWDETNTEWVCPYCGDESDVIVRCLVAAYVPSTIDNKGVVTIRDMFVADWDECSEEVVMCSACGEELSDMEIIYE